MEADERQIEVPLEFLFGPLNSGGLYNYWEPPKPRHVAFNKYTGRAHRLRRIDWNTINCALPIEEAWKQLSRHKGNKYHGLVIGNLIGVSEKTTHPPFYKLVYCYDGYERIVEEEYIVSLY